VESQLGTGKRHETARGGATVRGEHGAPAFRETGGASESGPAEILLLDPDRSTVEMVGELARTAGMSFRPFSSGLELLEARLERPGCLVCETRVPDVSASHLLRHLKEQEITVPVVFLSAHVTVSTAVRLMQQGAVTVLQKPCDPDVLWENVQSALRLGARWREERARLRGLLRQFAALSEDERRVLELTLEGRESREIAGLMSIAVRTVEYRRRSLREKLGVASISELTRKALPAYYGCTRCLDWPPAGFGCPNHFTAWSGLADNGKGGR
jgi:two-component system response regulator FixJ